MKRYRIKNKARFALFIISILMLFSIIVLLNTNALAGEVKPRAILVNNGDTLWSIAEENHDYKRQDIRQYIYEIRDLNNLETAEIYPSQELILPY